MQLGWVDFTKKDRDKVLAVISLLQERGVLDELGIGPIRDGFANCFFPGTSTVQTRAKYFLIVPYILQEAVDGKYGDQVASILKRIDDEERKCGLSLYNKYSNPIGVGIIGARLFPRSWVARKPSSIYWNGIRTYGISTHSSISIDEIVKVSVFDRMKKRAKDLGNKTVDAEEGEKDDMDAGRTDCIRFFDLPNVPDNWRDSLIIDLTQDEAVFLKKKILKSVPHSLLSWILNNINKDELAQIDKFDQLADFLQEKAPTELSQIMQLACQFDRLVFAARVRYNYILSGGKSEKAIRDWNDIQNNLSRATQVEINDVIAALQLPNSSSVYNLKRFLIKFKTALLKGDEAEMDEIIRRREINLKGKERSKLSHIEDFDPDSWFGGEHLDYRFADAKRIIMDIFDGEVSANVSY